VTVGDILMRTVLRAVDGNGPLGSIRRALPRWTAHDVDRLIRRAEYSGLIVRNGMGRYALTLSGQEALCQ
jgi:hypothetical protein